MSGRSSDMSPGGVDLLSAEYGILTGLDSHQTQSLRRASVFTEPAPRLSLRVLGKVLRLIRAASMAHQSRLVDEGVVCDPAGAAAVQPRAPFPKRTPASAGGKVRVYLWLIIFFVLLVDLDSFFGVNLVLLDLLVVVFFVVLGIH